MLGAKVLLESVKVVGVVHEGLHSEQVGAGAGAGEQGQLVAKGVEVMVIRGANVGGVFGFEPFLAGLSPGFGELLKTPPSGTDRGSWGVVPVVGDDRLHGGAKGGQACGLGEVRPGGGR